MVNENTIQFDFDDLLIEPASISYINSRKDINIYDEYGFLKIFTAPMFDVVNEENYKNYLDNKIYTILPRKKSDEYTEEYILSSAIYKFVSLGLDEFYNFFINDNTRIKSPKKVYILIDIANGHMNKLIDFIKMGKEKYGEHLVLMVGNIANPKTYFELSNAGVDLIRIGIGGGSACTTSANGAIGYSLASLLNNINEQKNFINNFNSNHSYKFAKIIADGGLKSFSDIIKAYALGAEYIILGGIFNKSFESSGKYFKLSLDDSQYYNIDKETAKKLFDTGYNVFKEYRGMSTKLIQSELGKEKLTTSEGIKKYNKVEYYLNTWVENFSDYLKSSLSYTNKKDIKDFIGNVNLNLISPASFSRYNK
jgi:GMP reductase